MPYFFSILVEEPMILSQKIAVVISYSNCFSVNLPLNLSNIIKMGFELAILEEKNGKKRN